MPPILITAATKWEAHPLAHGLHLSPSGDAQWNGQLGNHQITLIKTGMGSTKTAEALKELKPTNFHLALSAGLCGAMQPELRPGDIVADPHESEIELVTTLRDTAKSLNMPFHFGRILHTNIVLKPAAKKALGTEHRAVACDMETAAVRRWAHGTNLNVIATRAVLDGMNDDLPEDAPDSEDPATLAKFALTHAPQLPGLIKIGWRSGRAMKGLTRFLDAYLRAISAI